MLVRSDAPVKEIEDLSGSRICVARGTTTIDNLNRLAVPGLEIVSVLDAADCLVLFQDGEVDAITSNEIILRGYLTQDPYAAIVGRDLSDEPRGLAFHEADVDLVRFTNAVLAGLRRDGRLAEILQRHLRAVGVTVGRDVTVPGRCTGGGREYAAPLRRPHAIGPARRRHHRRATAPGGGRRVGGHGGARGARGPPGVRDLRPPGGPLP